MCVYVCVCLFVCLSVCLSILLENRIEMQVNAIFFFLFCHDVKLCTNICTDDGS